LLVNRSGGGHQRIPLIRKAVGIELQDEQAPRAGNGDGLLCDYALDAVLDVSAAELGCIDPLVNREGKQGISSRPASPSDLLRRGPHVLNLVDRVGFE
jgi:hypothetical protein